jgi:hypothetical protein
MVWCKQRNEMKSSKEAKSCSAPEIVISILGLIPEKVILKQRQQFPT